jgi:hypothetical protein
MAHLSFNMRGGRKGMKAQLQAFESDDDEELTQATGLQPAELQVVLPSHVACLVGLLCPSQDAE